MLTHHLLINTQKLVGGFVSDGCVTQARHTHAGYDVVQNVLRRQATRAAELRRRRNTVFKNAASQGRQLQNSHNSATILWALVAEGWWEDWQPFRKVT